MAPAPTLEVLISVVEADSAGADALGRLEAAASAAADLAEVSDALLDHFVDECRREGRSWKEISGALGVTRQAAHKRFSSAPATLERFTERARAALRAAVDEARVLGHNYVGTEHLLLGLYAPAEGIAARALHDLGAERSAVLEKVLEHLPTITPGAAPTAPPYTPRMRRCLEQAVEEALALGHNYIGTEHLLLALFDDQESLAAKVLRELGVEQDRCRAVIVAMLSGFTTSEGERRSS